MKLTALMWAALTVVVGISLFLLKYEVQSLEDQLRVTRTQIERDKSAIRVLEAEWAYLNDPGRLRRLSEQHLGFTAPAASQIITISQVPFKNGATPAPNAVSSPLGEPLPSAARLREAALHGASVINAEQTRLSQIQSQASLQLAAISEHPGVITNGIARLQRFLPASWTGTALSQESQP